MATLNNLGNITARCPGCNGALASFEWHQMGSQSDLGVITTLKSPPNQAMDHVDYRLFRCAGCGRGALGVVEHYGQVYPSVKQALRSFYPEAKERLALPKSVPEGIAKEFREGELCLEAGCLRAAAGMFRSVLDKTLRANGYKENERTNLKLQIDMAADDGVITEAERSEHTKTFVFLAMMSCTTNGTRYQRKMWRQRDITCKEFLKTSTMIANQFLLYFAMQNVLLMMINKQLPRRQIPDQLISRLDDNAMKTGG